MKNAWYKILLAISLMGGLNFAFAQATDLSPTAPHDAINVVVAAADNSSNNTVTPDDQPPTTVRLAEIQQILDHWRMRMDLPGATLSIYLPNQETPLTFASGSTSYYDGEPVNSNTLFQAGSITKSFTSMIILQLEAEGKLSLDDPITDYLPQYPQWQNVTIRELLNHTSGIFNYTETGTFNDIRKTDPREGFTPDEIVRIAAEHRDYFPPGEGWKYSNTNYVLAGMIIQKVTGEPVSEVINHYLHGGIRLNLLNTYYAPGLYTTDFLSRMAHGYNTRGIDVTTDNMSWAYTAGAIVTTTQDLLTWWHSLFQGNLLPPVQLQQMMSLVCEGTYGTCRPGEPMAHLNADEVGKGYGLGIIQTSFGSDRIGTVWWHNGSTAGYKAIVMWFPKSDIYMALTINRDPGYLLNPDLPVIRDILDVLIPNAEWHLAHPQPPRRFFHYPHRYFHHFIPRRHELTPHHHPVHYFVHPHHKPSSHHREEEKDHHVVYSGVRG